MKLHFCFISIITFVSYSCKEPTDEVSESAASSFDLIQSKILTPSCATPGCHASEKDGLILTKNQSYERLVNIDPSNANARKDGLKLIKAYSSEKSLFYHKLEDNSDGHHTADYGKRMPIGAKYLSNNQIEFVRRWIAAGAPKTGDIVDKKLLD
ncbi:MAG: hypothetical protein ACRCVT_14935 [Leadbetterella sp.]